VSEESETETPVELPACVGTQSPRSGTCIKKKVKPVCPKNKFTEDQEKIPLADRECRIQPFCDENPGLAVGDECFKRKKPAPAPLQAPTPLPAPVP